MTYTKVYGRVRAYQYNTTNSFQEYAGGQRGNSTIDEPYVDGVSLTYENPRRHIWTFASDLNILIILSMWNLTKHYHSRFCRR